MKNGSVFVDGEKITDWKNFHLTPGTHLIQIGAKNRKFFLLHVKD
jgi:hypothetical protein